MSGYLYFAAGERETIRPDKARALGLAHAFDKALTARGCTGPGSSRGAVFADPTRVPAERLGFYPDRQTWGEIDAERGVWVGFDKEDPPKATDLRRAKQMNGHLTRLNDGEDYLVPIALGLSQVNGNGSLQHYNACPASVQWDAKEKKWTFGGTQEGYEELWRLACLWYDAKVGGNMRDGKMIVEFDELAELATLALSINYVIERHEISLRGLCDHVTMRHVADMTIDTPNLIKWAEKKTEQERGG